MPKKWVVVAESSRARIFAMDGPGVPLRELEGLTHPEGRRPARELKSDRTARIFRGRGQANHPVVAHVEPRQQEAINFAKQIAERLHHARASGEFDLLVLAAAPEFLGILRDNLNTQTKKTVVHSVNKNLVQLTEAEIRQHVTA